MSRFVLAGLAALVVMLSASPALAKSKPTKHAPEFDVAAAGAVGAIVAGGGILLARRRRNRAQ
jgi:LPXTG-motif cell wall-anchored protein